MISTVYDSNPTQRYVLYLTKKKEKNRQNFQWVLTVDFAVAAEGFGTTNSTKRKA